MQSFNRYIILPVLTWIVISSCDQGDVTDCFKKKGKNTTVEYTLGFFHTVVVLDEVDIYLLNGVDQRVEVSAGKNLLPAIRLEVEDSVLTIRNKNVCNWVREPGNPGVYLYSNRLRRAEIYDYSNFYSTDTLELKKVELFSDGTGNFDLLINVDTLLIESIYISNFKISGKVDFLKIYFTDDSRFDGKKLVSDYNRIDHTGSNLIELYPIKELSGVINSTGDIHYYHEPELVNVTINHTGQLVDQSD
jgi:hypothetical protein